MTGRRHSISFIIPCLNEGTTLPTVLAKIRRVRETAFADRPTEVIVADNGSTDGSVSVALEHGARVVHCKEKGYGAALRCGIENALGEVIVFADADDTYDLTETPRLVAELETGFDLVLGSRLRGEIRPGSMPLLHRYAGTPLLSACINALYAGGGGRISDCNSGFRCFRRDSFFAWQVASTGMEFASEMLVKAMKARARVSEVPITFHPDVRGRVPHLKRWHDGMRHLLQIFVDSPGVFCRAGSAITAASWAIMLVSLFFGPLSLGIAMPFGIHTMMLALLGSLFGLNLWGVGLLLAVRQHTNIRFYRRVLDCPEGVLFGWSAATTGAGVALFAWIVFQWALHDFRGLALEKETLILIALMSNGVSFLFSVITAHLMKKT